MSNLLPPIFNPEKKTYQMKLQDDGTSLRSNFVDGLCSWSVWKTHWKCDVVDWTFNWTKLCDRCHLSCNSWWNQEHLPSFQRTNNLKRKRNLVFFSFPSHFLLFGANSSTLKNDIDSTLCRWNVRDKN